MTVFEALSLMIGFGILLLALLTYLKKQFLVCERPNVLISIRSTYTR